MQGVDDGALAAVEREGTAEGHSLDGEGGDADEGEQGISEAHLREG